VIVLDASVLIAHLDARDALHDRATEALLGVAATPLGASPLTVAEILVGPARVGRLDEAVGALRTIGISEIPLPPDAATRLAELRARSGLKLPDCYVILAAESAPADAVLTFDERLAAEAIRRGFVAA
jgi:predicted nucleic acid-binding protein